MRDINLEGRSTDYRRTTDLSEFLEVAANRIVHRLVSPRKAAMAFTLPLNTIMYFGGPSSTKHDPTSCLLLDLRSQTALREYVCNTCIDHKIYARTSY